MDAYLRDALRQAESLLPPRYFAQFQAICASYDQVLGMVNPEDTILERLTRTRYNAAARADLEAWDGDDVDPAARRQQLRQALARRRRRASR
jgi:hypothetical protein